MQHLFIPVDQISGDLARVIGSDHLHLSRVLRARPGDTLILLDNRGNAFTAVLVSLEKSETTAKIVGPFQMAPEPPIILRVAQALGKGDKFEQVIQHGTEAGASGFVPLQADRCIVEIPAAKIPERVARWQQISKSAAEQSHRLSIPVVEQPIGFLAFASAAPAGRTFILDTSPDAMPLRDALQGLNGATGSLTIAIGPEGGWTAREVSAASETGAVRVSLGPRVLRTETAALVAISQILFFYESVR